MFYKESKILSIDYGTKKTGIAISDASKTFAFGLTTVPTINIFNYFDTLFKTEDIELIVIGEPIQMNGAPSESEVYIQDFIKKFNNKYPIPIKRFDERFTSKMAFDTMIASGISKKKRQDKALVDKISATIILQGYLDSNNI